MCHRKCRKSTVSTRESHDTGQSQSVNHNSYFPKPRAFHMCYTTSVQHPERLPIPSYHQDGSSSVPEAEADWLFAQPTSSRHLYTSLYNAIMEYI